MFVLRHRICCGAYRLTNTYRHFTFRYKLIIYVAEFTVIVQFTLQNALWTFDGMGILSYNRHTTLTAERIQAYCLQALFSHSQVRELF